MTGIWVAVLVLLSACGAGDEAGDVVSLEPHPLESSNAADSRGSNSVAGIEGESGSIIGVNGGSGDISAGTNGGSGSIMADTNGGTGSTADAAGTPVTDKESAATGNGSGGAGNASVVPESGTGTASAQEALLSNINAGVKTASESLSDTDRKIYLQVVMESAGDSNIYSLIWLDGDMIPELVICDNDFSEYSIYTVKDNTVFCMADSIGTVELTYFERCGVIASFSRWNGGGDEGGYGSSYDQVSKERTITNDDQAVLSYSYNASYNEKGEYTGTGVTDYFYMGQEIEEAAYQENMKSLGIAAGEDRRCMENSCGKEEMIALLNQ